MLREIFAFGRAAALSAALALAVSACGIKGPLKLPTAPPAAPASSAPAASPGTPAPGAPDAAAAAGAGSATQPTPDEGTPGKKP